MPNTPARIRQGMTALCPGQHADERHMGAAEALFGPLGRTVQLDEKHFNAVTGLSASGPAFITPAGCTIDGILKLEEGGLRVTLIKTVVEASRRAGGLMGG